MENNFGSSGRKKNYIISHSGKFKSKNRKRISITDQVWIVPAESPKGKVSQWTSRWAFTSRINSAYETF